MRKIGRTQDKKQPGRETKEEIAQIHFAADRCVAYRTGLLGAGLCPVSQASALQRSGRLFSAAVTQMPHHSGRAAAPEGFAGITAAGACGAPKGNRTPVSALRGPRPNR